MCSGGRRLSILDVTSIIDMLHEESTGGVRWYILVIVITNCVVVTHTLSKSELIRSSLHKI